MKLIYLFVLAIFIVVLLLGKSIFSSATAVTSVASNSLGQKGGRKLFTLQSVLYIILAVALVSFILSKYPII